MKPRSQGVTDVEKCGNQDQDDQECSSRNLDQSSLCTHLVRILPRALDRSLRPSRHPLVRWPRPQAFNSAQTLHNALESLDTGGNPGQQDRRTAPGLSETPFLDNVTVARPGKHAPEVRERADRMVLEQEGEYPYQRVANLTVRPRLFGSGFLQDENSEGVSKK